MSLISEFVASIQGMVVIRLTQSKWSRHNVNSTKDDIQIKAVANNIPVLDNLVLIDVT